MRARIASAVAALLLSAGCGGADPTATTGDLTASTGDPLCDALVEARASGLVAALSGGPRVLGDRPDAEDADARAERAAQALAELEAATPAELRADAQRVTEALERFTTVLNDPGPGTLLDALQATGRTPEERAAFRESVRRMNALTEQRCGEPLVDPVALER